MTRSGKTKKGHNTWWLVCGPRGRGRCAVRLHDQSTIEGTPATVVGAVVLHFDRLAIARQDGEVPGSHPVQLLAVRDRTCDGHALSVVDVFRGEGARDGGALGATGTGKFLRVRSSCDMINFSQH